ncbi:hypothetical protein C7B82_22770 [Stenomitos frigidus ULC18]|uniref:Uncharacterized protein n=1 Tax=Stenomitos frigidus ULC18 TaxID=2107698 RepID=A0A2T1DYP8_9CYAN|nr:hypothetical protein C7B82_22770 [Stenomitos frigidus ULC18]
MTLCEQKKVNNQAEKGEQSMLCGHETKCARLRQAPVRVVWYWLRERYPQLKKQPDFASGVAELLN